MVQPTHVHCRHCGLPRPLRFSALLNGEPCVGTSLECGECSYVAFTLVRMRGATSQFSFCANCDAFCRVRVEASKHTGNIWICCGACGYALATLYAPEPTSAAPSPPRTPTTPPRP